MIHLAQAQPDFQSRFVITIIFLAIFFSNTVIASKYPPEINLLKVLEDKNISLGEVETMMQDKDGFLWFGGRSALLRYDGYDFVPMQLELGGGGFSKKIKLSQVMDILQDRRGDIWAATRIGLCKLDKNRDVFVKVRPKNSEEKLIFSQAISRLAEAPSGEILLGAYVGLGIYDSVNHILTNLVHDPDQPESILDNFINDIFVDDGYVWLGTNFGISKLDWDSKKSTNYTFEKTFDVENSQNTLESKLAKNLLVSDGSFSTPGHQFKFNLDGATLAVSDKIELRINKVSRESWRVQVLHHVHVEKAQQYTLCYDAKAESARDIFINIDTGPEDYESVIGGAITHSIQEHYKTYSHTVVVNKSQINARITFGLGGSDVDTFIDNIGLYQGGSCGDPFVGDPANRKVERNKRKYLGDNAINTIIADKEGKIWAGTNNGSYKLDPNTGHIKHYAFDENNTSGMIGKVIHDIYLDSSGLLWFGSDDGSVGLYNYEADKFKWYEKKYTDGSVKRVSVQRIFEDAASDVWFGYFPEGIEYYDRSSSAVMVYKYSADGENSVLHNSVRGLQEDDLGNIWVGSLGIHYWDRKQDHFFHYTFENGALPSNSVQSVYLDRGNDLWVGTWGSGVLHLNNGGAAFEQVPYQVDNTCMNGEKSFELPSSSVWSIVEDSQGYIWLGTHNGGLHRYNKKIKEFTCFVHDPGDTTTLSNNLVWSLLEDSNQYLWVGTAWGLNRFDPKTEKFKQFYVGNDGENSLSNNNVVGAFEDSKGFLWFATDFGLNKFDPSTEIFTAYTMKEGLVDNGIRSITEDGDGRIWVTTMNGFSVFDPIKESFKNTTQQNAEKLGSFNLHSAMLSHRGEIILGGAAGLRVFNVNEMKGNQYAPPVVLTDFSLFTKSVAVGGPNGLLDSIINLTEEIVLDYKKTMISFSFAALNYRDSASNQYAYKLEGFDEDWRQVGNQRTAVYTNLDPGHYTFRVKGTNNDGVEGENIKTIKILQLPPPWLTVWAKMCYVGLLVFSVFRTIQYQRQKRQAVELRNKILEDEVAQRTVELRRKNSDIQAMLSNMPQGLFTIGEELKIHHEYSVYLERIFETTDIAGRDAVEVLFSGAQLDCNRIDEVTVSILSIIGQDTMNFDLNSHLLIDKYEVNNGLGVKYLALEWSPIVENNLVDKIMVSVRDVTELKKIEGETFAQQRELNIISQLIQVSDRQFLDFKRTSYDSCLKIDSILHDGQAKKIYLDRVDLDKIFRYLHTVKGNSRTYGLTFFSEVVHNAESQCAQMINSFPDKGSKDSIGLIDENQKIVGCLSEYEKVFYEVLDRGKGVADYDNTYDGVDGEVLALIRQGIKKISTQFKGVEEIDLISKQFDHLLDMSLSLSLEQVLQDIVLSLPSISEGLGKPTPELIFQCDNMRIKTQGCDLLKDIFAHILRNSLDHGIEIPDIRRSKNKPERGIIHISLLDDPEKIVLKVYDDGQGIHLSALFQKGVSQGLWCDSDRPSDEELASLIFESGVSTKEKVSDISGRGVGMNAVKAFLKEQGGDITINVLDHPSDAEYAPFELLMMLPQQDVFRVSDT